MPVSIYSATKRLCEKSNWTISHLHIQKMNYIAHMFFLGDHGEPLVDGHFEAWALGPVNPYLYQILKRYGANHVMPGALEFAESIPDSHPSAIYLDSALELPRQKLVAITHWKNGAWRKNYQPNTRGNRISNEDIIEESNKRKKA